MQKRAPQNNTVLFFSNTIFANAKNLKKVRKNFRSKTHNGKKKETNKKL